MSNKTRRRTKTSRKQNEIVNKFDNLESLTLLDVQCTVCMGIFIEPVTLPCHHCTCKVCFEKTLDNNTLACPLCRKYVGGWVRHRQKNGLLVDKKLWAFIQQRFQSHVDKKLNGEDDEEIDDLTKLHTPSPQISEPGLIRLEYEAEQKRHQEEALKRQEEEARASELLIKELQEREEEERKRLEELRRKTEEEDALVAQRIAAQLAAEQAQQEGASSAFAPVPTPVTTNQESPPQLPQPSTSTNPHSQVRGPMDVFLSQIGIGKNRTGSTGSVDSFRGETQYFQPLEIVPKTPPKKSKDGKAVVTPVRKPIPVMRSLDGWPCVGPSALRPWAQQNKNDAASYQRPSSSQQHSAEKRPCSPTIPQGKQNKRPRRESPRKSARLFAMPVSEITDMETVNLKGREKKDSDNDLDDVRSPKKTPSKARKSLLNYTPSKSTATSCSTFNNLHPSLLPLCFEDLSEQAHVEEKYRQEQRDYEFALKLQNELNAVEGQSRSYELRSIVSLSPKKNQAKVTPTRGKTRPKPATSSTKERRRQCTLEETISFSVKMKL